jgi:hypothetical protein
LFASIEVPLNVVALGFSHFACHLGVSNTNLRAQQLRIHSVPAKTPSALPILRDSLGD